MIRPRPLRAGPLLTLILCAGAAAVPAAAMPPEVEAMVREAARGGDDATLNAVVRVARATNPDDADEIQALGSSEIAKVKAQVARAREERLAAQRMLEGWSGQGQAGAGFSSGNTRETSVVVGLNVTKEGRFIRHKFTGLVDYLRSNGITSRQKYALGYSGNYALRNGMSLVGTLGWEQDRFAGYTRRFTESFGLGYRALNKRGMTLDLEAAPALRQTLFVGGGSEEDFAARFSLAYRWQMNPGMQFTQNASVLTGDENTTINATSALTAKLSGKLSGRLSFNVQKETDPPIGRQSTDTSTRATLVFDF